MIQQIETERLLMRPLQSDDDLGMFELDSDPEVHRYLGNNPVKDIQKIREVITFVNKQYSENGIGRFAVIEKSTDSFMGWCGLKWIDEELNSHQNFYDLGYRFIRKYWGKGYASESCKPWLDYAKEILHASELFASVNEGNKASCRVLEKNGFVHTGDYLSESEMVHWFEKKL